MSEDAKRWVGLAVLVLMVGFAGWFVVFGRGGDGGSGSGGRAGGEPTSSATGAAAPSQDPATTPEPTPTPTGPIPPPRPADELSDAGAAAFLQYWMDALNWSTETMDIGPVAAASAQDCGKCQEIIARTREDVAAGRRYEDGAYSIRIVSVEPLQDGASPLVRQGVVMVDSNSYRVYGPDGALYREDPPEVGTQFSFTIRRGTNGGWFVSALYLFKAK